ncbi:60S ribosomal protein L10e, putative [Theileria equi strain WA]|uniref:Ribosome assembly factor mrt4 n=1 Tax=Theileria equi strain WA TaxID=1537102 RepID=L1LFI9_THEEQ|nr:60S ribosomal protein L10e, putative [Theileria equi strain WA]EKX74197.1 60S ribosomal protein L10e, putative [Theileria equi strain WA]|eukprot:XP_004833649.1 60S ribosomal protein L10e, putative [Theileria equi strain WA]
MAVSKRKKVVNLTSCKKDAKTRKNNLVESIRNTINKFSEAKESEAGAYIYLLSLSNQRNSPLKNLRAILLPGRLFYGKNKVMQLALGTKPENELYDGVHKIAKDIVGEVALLVTSDHPDLVAEKVNSYKVRDFAKSGNIATETIVLKEGGSDFEQVPGNMEAQFRNLGLPTSLKMGKIVLMGDYVLSEEGKPLTPNQAHVLKLLGIRTAVFSAKVHSCLSDGEYKVFN